LRLEGVVGVPAGKKELGLAKATGKRGLRGVLEEMVIGCWWWESFVVSMGIRGYQLGFVL
jgi:hypothetical protein